MTFFLKGFYLYFYYIYLVEILDDGISNCILGIHDNEVLLKLDVLHSIPRLPMSCCCALWTSKKKQFQIIMRGFQFNVFQYCYHKCRGFIFSANTCTSNWPFSMSPGADTKRVHAILKPLTSPRRIFWKLLQYLQQLEQGQWQLTTHGLLPIRSIFVFYLDFVWVSHDKYLPLRKNVD